MTNPPAASTWQEEKPNSSWRAGRTSTVATCKSSWSWQQIDSPRNETSATSAGTLPPPPSEQVRKGPHPAAHSGERATEAYPCVRDRLRARRWFRRRRVSRRLRPPRLGVDPVRIRVGDGGSRRRFGWIGAGARQMDFE